MNKQRQKWLEDFVRNKSNELKKNIDEQKQKAILKGKEPEWLWSAFLDSMSTYGSEKGYARLHDPNRDFFGKRLSFKNIHIQKDDAARRELLEEAFRVINPRYLLKKVETLLSAYHRIMDLGGLEEAKKKALSQSSTESKIKFMQKFWGIGPKYARNIWMDIYDPHFRNSIAKDVRLEKVARMIDENLSKYDEFESFYKSLADRIGIEAWVVDRVVFHVNKDKSIEEKLKAL